jgi:FAD:protein FMN transferase
MNTARSTTLSMAGARHPTRGEPASERPWAVGISDPHDTTQLLTAITGRDLAVATSGNAERGMHIRNAFTGRPVTDIASATVVGPSLTFADAYATAAVVLGTPGWLDSIDGYAALLVDAHGGIHPSHRWQHRFTTTYPQPEPERTP